jgi:hypothetical protein
MKLLLMLALQAGDLDALLDGVKTIAAPGAPGPVLAFGDRAFPVVVGGASKTTKAPVVAAAQWEQGRVVALGHNGYFGKDAIGKGDTGRFLLNAARWAGAKAAPRVGVGGWNDLAGHYRQAGLAVTELSKSQWAAKFGELDVVAVPPDWPGPDEVAKLAEFIKRGGGFLSGVPGWGWQSLNSGKRLEEDFPGNRLLEPAGLVWVDGTLDRTAPEGYDASARPGPYVHSGKALAWLAEAAAGAPKEDLLQASDAASRLARSVPAALVRFELPAARGLTRPLDRVLLARDIEQFRRLPPASVKAHPEAEKFPGPVAADAPRVERAIAVDLAAPGWRSTGLYAPPGGLIRVKASRAGLHLRIGCHTDKLWHLETWKRVPDVTLRVPLAAGFTEVASPFGGLIYLEGGPAEIVVSGAVEAPLYELDRTDAAAWKAMRGRPAPWGELATKKVILTVPTKVLRELDDPAELMRFWDRAMDAVADLATIPRERPRPERYVPDVQISAGYMHSGYPIMTHLDVERKLVDVAALKKDGWGFWHETGHNHQAGDWTFEGTGEVTCNLFSVYVCETVCGQAVGHGGVRPEQRKKAREKHFAAGAPFDGWKKDPFLALDMDLLLQEAFGWETYKKVFAEYRTLPAAERPKGDAAKRDQWMVRFSKACGKNLGPYFKAWGVPVSEEALKAIEGLPEWKCEAMGDRR